LDPKAQVPFQIRFHPQEAGDFAEPFRLHTLLNHFEDATFQLRGMGYMEEVSWDLPDVTRPALQATETGTAAALPAPDELNLGEVALGSSASVTFSINNTSNKAIRFEFPLALPAPFTNCLQITPSVGHVLPKSQKPIVFTFSPEERLSVKDVLMPTSLASIVYVGEAEAWDDSMRNGDYGPTPTTSPRGDPKGGAEVVGNTETDSNVKPEPPHQIIDGTTKELVLKLSAAADQRAYTCSTENLHFAPTVMFQTKIHRFTVGNISEIGMPFQWSFRTADGNGGNAPPGAKAFSIQPKAGMIAAGSSQEFTVRFSPTEIENFACSLECEIPHLPKESNALRVAVNATAIRPWCHFELPPSDYRTRRQSDSPLDPKYHIIEFESLGTRVKNTKRFYVLNPTSESYEFSWSPEATQSAGGKEDQFRCLSRRGVIQSGKKI
jgi:hydrocephalus-inducing protein